MSNKKCCVPGCKVIRGEVPLHSFPNPEKEPDRFKSWLYNVGGDVLALDNQFIYKRRRVCHNHFEEKYHTWTGHTLAVNAVPTLQLSGFRKKAVKRPLSDVTNFNEETPHQALSEPKEKGAKTGAVSDMSFHQGTPHQALSEPNEPSTLRGLNQGISHLLPSTSKGLSEPSMSKANQYIPHPEISKAPTSNDAQKKPAQKKKLKIRDLKAKFT